MCVLCCVFGVVSSGPSSGALLSFQGAGSERSVGAFGFWFAFAVPVPWGALLAGSLGVPAVLGFLWPLCFPFRRREFRVVSTAAVILKLTATTHSLYVPKLFCTRRAVNLRSSSGQGYPLLVRAVAGPRQAASTVPRWTAPRLGSPSLGRWLLDHPTSKAPPCSELVFQTALLELGLPSLLTRILNLNLFSECSS